MARVCLAIAEHPEDARRLTIKRNTVAVVTDGSAVLGLGNIGPTAALPVMEGKAALFKQFGGVDAWPVCLDTQDTDAIVEIVRAIAPVYGGINLEDISAPRCFEIEARLRELLDIPVFHDDQHGTAIVVLAALTNALRVVGKRIEDVRIVVSGVGAAGHAIIRLLLAQGAGDDHRLRPRRDRPRRTGGHGPVPRVDRRAHQQRPARRRRSRRCWPAPTCSSASPRPTCSPARTSPRWPTTRSSSPSPTRCPRSTPIAASEHAAVVATGRSDYANQINNVLVFPGFFRGLLDAGVSDITDEMLIAAATAIADTVDAEELNASYIIPSVFDPDVAPAVAAAVRRVASAAAHGSAASPVSTTTS